MKTTWLVVLAVVVLVGLVGCEKPLTPAEATQVVEKGQTALDVIDQALQDLESKRQEVDAELATMPAGPDRERMQAVSTGLELEILKFQAARAKLAEQLDAFAQKLKDASDEIDLFESIGKGASTYLPGLWGLVATLGVSLAAAVWRAVKKNGEAKAGKAVILALEAAKTDGVVNFADAATVNRLNVVMGEAGRSLVDKVQGAVVMESSEPK